MSYESTLTRDERGYCKLFGIEFKRPGQRVWKRCSLTMHNRDAITQNGALLAHDLGWVDWRVIEVA